MKCCQGRVVWLDLLWSSCSGLPKIILHHQKVHQRLQGCFALTTAASVHKVQCGIAKRDFYIDEHRELYPTKILKVSLRPYLLFGLRMLYNSAELFIATESGSSKPTRASFPRHDIIKGEVAERVNLARSMEALSGYGWRFCS